MTMKFGIKFIHNALTGWADDHKYLAFDQALMAAKWMNFNHSKCCGNANYIIEPRLDYE
jgi:hypothetical protein